MSAMVRSGRPEDGDKGVRVGPGELAALLFQSILLAASLGFMATILLARFPGVPRAIAFGGGLELGLLASYPTIRIVARSSGARLGFWTWLGLTLVPTVLGVTLLGVL